MIHKLFTYHITLINNTLQETMDTESVDLVFGCVVFLGFALIIFAYVLDHYFKPQIISNKRTEYLIRKTAMESNMERPLVPQKYNRTEEMIMRDW